MAVWVLDASHGGNDTGAIGTMGRRESDIVLEAVLEAKKHLERNGEQVFLIRDCDIYLDFQSRIKIASQCKGKYFISFHMDCDIDKSIKGVRSVYYNDSDDAKRLARLVKDEIFSGLRTDDRGTYKDANTELESNQLVIVEVYGDFLSNESVEREFDSKKYGMLVAKGCLSMVDKVLLLSPITEPKKTQKRAWRICTGYYKDYDEACEVILKMKKEGVHDAYIIPYDGR